MKSNFDKWRDKQMKIIQANKCFIWKNNTVYLPNILNLYIYGSVPATAAAHKAVPG